ncbi:MAG: helix-turn-helix transcriptional regulator [Cyclobacteriaceae bacterium]
MQQLRVTTSSRIPNRSSDIRSTGQSTPLMTIHPEFINVKNRLYNSIIEFTEREVDILKQMSFGLTADKIGETLHISPNTVKTHIKNMLKKSGSTNSVEMIANALRQQVIC